MKQRFSYLDLQIITNELKPLLNHRLQNIYDLTSSSRQFLLKFAIPDSKKLVIVDPGFRIHLTDYNRSTALSPSGFVAKLRKHLKGRRLNEIKLAPLNRLLVLSFSDDNSYHLVFEFFAGGNLILLDKEHKILSLQRVVSASETQTRCAVGEIYPLDTYLNPEDQDTNDEIAPEKVSQWLEAVSNEKSVDKGIPEDNDESVDNREQENPLQQKATTSDKRVGGKSKSIPLKKVLYMNLPGVATGIIEASLIAHSLNPNAKATEVYAELDTKVSAIVDALKDAKSQSAKLSASPSVSGYILARRNPRYKEDKEKPSTLSAGQDITSIDPHNIEYLYHEFQPFKPQIPEQDSHEYKLIETPTYNQAVDIYFSTIEATKFSLRAANQELVAEKRLRAARAEKDKRVKGLADVQEKSEKMGNALLRNAELVEEAAEAVRGLLRQSMDWVDIEKLIKLEKSRDNPVAEVIALPLNLKKNKISVILPDPTVDHEIENEDAEDSGFSSDEEEESAATSRAVPKVKVEIDLGLSAWANASNYFDVKKTAAAKQERTIQSADQAYKSAEKKIKRDLKHTLEKERNQQTMHAIRELFWFEKFYWFLSSDGYLVIGGHDTMQNELLFRRFFKPHDILVHCDGVEGAAVVIIKNHMQVDIVPPSTLNQAGALSIAASTKVWESKMAPSPWWAVYSKVPKVYKGELVRTTHLIVNGEKNFIPPPQLDMGFGFMWLVGEDKLENYQKYVPELPDQAEEDEKDSAPEPREATPEQNATEVDGDNDESDSSDEEFFPDTQVSDEPGNNPSLTVPSTTKEPPLTTTGEDESDNGSSTSSTETPPPTAVKDEDESSHSATVSDIEKALEDLKTSGRNHSAKSDQKPPKVRGKKGKLKKMATKYAHQDEEDRRRAMELLGTTKGMERAKAEKEAAQKKRLEQDRIKKERAQRAKQAELKRLAEEETHPQLSANEMLFPFGKLVPKVVSGDKPIAAVPTFGPWGAIQRLKYRVKMQQGGNLKKGKAVREIVYSLTNPPPPKMDKAETDTELSWPCEIDLIKSVQETQLLLPVAVSKVKIATGSGSDKAKKSQSTPKNKKKK
ncbi:ribosome quality control complex subunit 2 [Trichomonascus vanleenenianus]|uniref:Rqc2p n=1 Tax=Trichomonascus vanleenenianus TaxID=2268995 RepID=UPI003ECB4672